VPEPNGPPKPTPRRLRKWRCFDASGISVRPTLQCFVEGTGDDGRLYTSAGHVVAIAPKNRKMVRTDAREVILLDDPSPRYVGEMDAISAELDWKKPFDDPTPAPVAPPEIAAPAPQAAATPHQRPWTGLLARLAASLQPRPKSAKTSNKGATASGTSAAPTAAATKKRVVGMRVKPPSATPGSEGRSADKWP